VTKKRKRKKRKKAFGATSGELRAGGGGAIPFLLSKASGVGWRIVLVEKPITRLPHYGSFSTQKRL